MIDFLEACVRIPSLSRRERPVAEFLRDQMLARGYDRAYIDPSGSAVGVIGSGPRQIVLLGHMDTVGGDVPVRYAPGDDTGGPALYGRGTVDAKGPLCAFVLACETLARGRLPAEWQLIVVGATEEEAASSAGAHYSAAQFSPAMCVIGEPSGSGGITVGYKGRILVDARASQPSQHTAVPGPSASEQAVALWNWFRGYSDRFNEGKPKAFDQLLPGLRSIQSGDDGLKEWCDVRIGIRLPVEFGPPQVEAAFREQAAAMLAASDRLTLTMDFVGREQAYRSARDTDLARALVDSIRAEKLRPAFKEKTGTADFNILGPAWNVPIVAYGPGDSKLDHTPNEHVEVAEFERGVRILARALAALTGANLS